MRIKLTVVQIQVLEKMVNGGRMGEFLTPFGPRFFRTLGMHVAARLNYVIGGQRVRYQTFRSLFRRNLIEANERRGQAVSSPQDGITGFSVTLLGLKAYAEACNWRERSKGYHVGGSKEDEGVDN